MPRMRSNGWSVAQASPMAVATLGLAVLFLGFAGGSDVARADGRAGGGGGGVVQLNDPSRIGHIQLTLNKSHTMRVNRPVAEALVASSDIADVVPLTDQSIYLVGKHIGLTRLTLLGADKRLLGIVEIEVSFDVKGLREELDRNVSGAQLRITTANGRIILGGMVPDADRTVEGNGDHRAVHGRLR